MSRHAWEKISLHHYRCTRCGIDKEHVQGPAGADPFAPRRWLAVFLRDGVPVAQGRTPPCPGTPAPDLTWKRGGPYWWQAPTGHRISVSRGLSGLRYSAWGTDIAPGVHWRDYPPGGRWQYPRGVPFPLRHPLLGVYADPAAARRACALHAAGLP